MMGGDEDMEFTCTMESGGRVLIPSRIREHLGIEPSSRPTFRVKVEGRKIILEGINSPPMCILCGKFMGESHENPVCPRCQEAYMKGRMMEDGED